MFLRFFVTKYRYYKIIYLLNSTFLNKHSNKAIQKLSPVNQINKILQKCRKTPFIPCRWKIQGTPHFNSQAASVYEPNDSRASSEENSIWNSNAANSIWRTTRHFPRLKHWNTILLILIKLKKLPFYDTTHVSQVGTYIQSIKERSAKDTIGFFSELTRTVEIVPEIEDL